MSCDPGQYNENFGPSLPVKPLSINRFELSLDRIEGNQAVLVLASNEIPVEVIVPIWFLPAEARTGQILEFRVSVDIPATRALQEETRKVQNKLSKKDPGGDIKL